MPGHSRWENDRSLAALLRTAASPCLWGEELWVTPAWGCLPTCSPRSCGPASIPASQLFLNPLNLALGLFFLFPISSRVRGMSYLHVGNGKLQPS